MAIIIFFSDIPARNKPFRKERDELPGSGNFPAGAARRRGHAHREGDSGESALTGAPSPPFGPSCSSHGSRNLAVSPLRRSPATLTFIARGAPFVLSPQPRSPRLPGSPNCCPSPLSPTRRGLTWWAKGRVPPRSGSSPGTGKVSG